MSPELSLTFPDPGHVQISLRREDGTDDSPPQPFVPPLDQQTRQDLTWYLETYPVHYTTELDDARAAGIAAKLKDWGGALFRSVFADLGAHSLFVEFQRTPDAGRLLTISSLHPTVLAQPWELLCDPNSTFLYLQTPHISIRRRLPGGIVQSFRPVP